MSSDQQVRLQALKPSISINRVDYDRLAKLAATADDRFADVAEVLLDELDRAAVVDTLPSGIVHMGSTVEYRADDGQQRRVTLVYPGQADIALGKISILTPIGAALIGLSANQSIDWTAPDGRRHVMTILSVDNSELHSGERA
jgi:regulator of nucleoside diphosphate kinase